MDIGPIAEVVVKRAAPYCASDEALCMKVAEEIESEQQREKFLKRVASTLSMPLVTAASSSKSRQAPVVVKTPEVSSASNKAIDQPKSSGRRKVLVPVFVGIAAIALAGIALVGLRKRSSERDVLAPAAVSLPENGKPEEPSRAPSQELTTANRPAETPRAESH